MRDPDRPAEDLAALRAQLVAQAARIAHLEAALARERRRTEAAEAARDAPGVPSAPRNPAATGGAAGGASPAGDLSLAALVRGARRERGWSQKALAARVGCTPKTIWRLEHNPRLRPHVRIRNRLAAALDLPLDTVREAVRRQRRAG